MNALVATTILTLGALLWTEQDVELQPADFSEPPAVLDAQALESDFERGVDAWRAGDRERAERTWADLLARVEADAPVMSASQQELELAALFGNLGNAAFRAERDLEAVGWYTAALEHAPRDADWAANRDLAARRAEVVAQPSRGVVAEIEQLLRSTTEYEARWLALLGLIPLAAALLNEALRGGRLARILAALGFLAAGVCAAPFLLQRFAPLEPRVMSIVEDGAALRSEPLAEAARIRRLDPGHVAQSIDQLDDWVRVELDDGTRGWVASDEVFRLRR